MQEDDMQNWIAFPNTKMKWIQKKGCNYALNLSKISPELSISYYQINSISDNFRISLG